MSKRVRNLLVLDACNPRAKEIFAMATYQEKKYTDKDHENGSVFSPEVSYDEVLSSWRTKLKTDWRVRKSGAGAIKWSLFSRRNIQDIAQGWKVHVSCAPYEASAF